MKLEFFTCGSFHIKCPPPKVGYVTDLYIWVIKDKCKNMVFFGPKVAAKLGEIAKNGADKASVIGCNFFVFEDY